jgi:hypothetical protein
MSNGIQTKEVTFISGYYDCNQVFKNPAVAIYMLEGA